MGRGRHARARGVRLHRRTAAVLCAALLAASAGVFVVEPSGVAASVSTVASVHRAPSSVHRAPDSRSEDEPGLADTGTSLDVTVAVGLALLLGGTGLVLLAARAGRRR